jgi:hypothetical protein
MQVELLWDSIVLRGAITVGSIVRSYGQLFGPALIKAYDLETNVAIYPRVVVDEVVFREAKRNPALTGHSNGNGTQEILSLLCQDRDAHRFIDYLAVLRHRSEPRSFRRFLKHHRNLIKDGIAEYRGNERVLAKYNWMAGYHNHKIKELGIRNASSLSISR